MSVRCEPTDDFRGKDWWHWLQLEGSPEPDCGWRWVVQTKRWRRPNGSWSYPPERMAKMGYSYVGPVAPFTNVLSP